MGVTADMTGESKHSAAAAADGGDSKVREWTNRGLHDDLAPRPNYL